jgi:hypothetical protein
MNGLDTICAFRRLALDMPLVAMSSQIANCPATRPISSDVGESAGRLPAGQAVQA